MGGWAASRRAREARHAHVSLLTRRPASQEQEWVRASARAAGARPLTKPQSDASLPSPRPVRLACGRQRRASWPVAARRGPRDDGTCAPPLAIRRIIAWGGGGGQYLQGQAGTRPATTVLYPS
eukprot:scaffold1017_cov374-Prasinococcus_capsulatus_cf.AAC.1